MSDNQKRGPNEKKTNQIINEQIAKIQKDTQELIDRTINGQTSSVNVVKVSENKIIIEVDLNELNKNTSTVDNLVDPIQQTSSTNNNRLQKEENRIASDCCSTPKSSKLKGDDCSNQQTTNQLNDQSNFEQNTDLDKPLKGILKYTKSWKKRTLSESSFDYSSSFTDHEDDENTFNLSLSCSDLDADRSASKKVTFNKQISSKVFTKNQRTIESRSKKGKSKKKHLNKKAKKEDKKLIITNESTKKSNQTEMKLESSEKGNKMLKKLQEEVSIDELSFLICSSESEASTSSLQVQELSELATKTTSNCIEEDDLLDLQAKIEHQPFDEDWNEVTSKKLKKNRKRNDSGSTASVSKEPRNENNLNDANVRVANADEQQKMSLGLKQNLEIQVN